MNKKEITAEFFNQVASSYDRVGPRLFSHFGHCFAKLAQIPENASVLDIASGRGAVLFPAAEMAGPYGRVTGIDLSDEMVRETSAEIAELNLKNAEMLKMDADNLDFPDNSFDFVLCGFGIFLFSDFQQLFKKFARVLKPGGQVGVTVFSERGKYFKWFEELIFSFTETCDLQGIEIQKTYSPRLFTSAELEEILKTAGFEGVHVTDGEAGFIYNDEDELWASLWSHGARPFISQLSPELQDNFKTFVYDYVQEIKHSDGIHTPSVGVLYGFGN
ncbi:MAG: class I SAM-dependent methyltransferase [Desulfobacteraceae bacterium]|nr:class I SAM-dependent methyltransferase [Desulfobacteraceae bacterium]